MDWVWSVSKSHLLDRCPRAFSYSTLSQEHSLPDKSHLNMAAIGGVAIHRAISEQLDNWEASRSISPLEAISQTERFIDGVWSSRSRRVVEVMNGFEPDPRVLYSIKRAAVSRLERFFRMLWPQFTGCKHIEHERLHWFDTDSVRFAVRVDLACKGPEGDFWIVDWKTGGWENERSGRPQLAAYTLWANVSCNVPVENIVPMIVGLETGRITRFRPVAQDLEYIVEVAKRDQARVSQYFSQGKFPAAADPPKCWGCEFLKQCDEGMSAVGL